MIGPVLLALAACVSAQETPYSATDLAAIHQSVDEFIRKGRFLQAAAKLREMKRERIPAGDAAARVQEAETRVSTYAALLLETAAKNGTDAATARKTLPPPTEARITYQCCWARAQVLLVRTLPTWWVQVHTQ